MSYNKTIWTAGDVITAEKLNNIEDGIEAADKPISIPVYIVIGIGGENLWKTSTKKPGELSSFDDEFLTATGVNDVLWRGDNFSGPAPGIYADFDIDEGHLYVDFYQPATIPQGADRLVVSLLS